MKKFLSDLKPYLRWAILGGTLFFLLKALKDNWQDVAAIRLDTAGWALLSLSLGVTLIAHTWGGWVWGWILRGLGQSQTGYWACLVYLKTNITKYLPGNVWQFVGRISAVTATGGSLGVATVSVLLEPLLMVAGALAIAMLGSQSEHWSLQFLSLAFILIGIHPFFLNRVLQYLRRIKGKVTGKTSVDESTNFTLERYPLLPLLGEVGFVGLRGTGFLCTLLPFASISLEQVPSLLSAFSIAWLLGMILPGAPGGIGVFEATAIALLDSQYSPAILLSSVAFYRPISILAEAAGAGLAWIIDGGKTERD